MSLLTFRQILNKKTKVFNYFMAHEKKEYSMTKFRTTCHCVHCWGTWGLHIETNISDVGQIKRSLSDTPMARCLTVAVRGKYEQTERTKPQLFFTQHCSLLTLLNPFDTESRMKIIKTAQIGANESTKEMTKTPRLDTVLSVSSVRWYQYKTAFYTVLHVQIRCATAVIRRCSTQLAKHQHFVQFACLMIKSKPLHNILISDLMAHGQACQCCDFHGFHFCLRATLRLRHCDESCESHRQPEQTKGVLQDFYERLRNTGLLKAM